RACTDPATLARWTVQAVTAPTAEAAVAEPAAPLGPRPPVVLAANERELGFLRRAQVLAHRAALETVLAVRGIAVRLAQRARLETCRDLKVLDAWIARAVTATTLAEVVGPGWDEGFTEGGRRARADALFDVLEARRVAAMED